MVVEKGYSYDCFVVTNNQLVHVWNPATYYIYLFSHSSCVMSLIAVFTADFIVLVYYSLIDPTEYCIFLMYNTYVTQT